MTVDREQHNIHDLLGSIDWEGGLYEIMTAYGMTDVESYDIPDYIKEKWTEVADCAADLDLEMEELYTMMYKFSQGEVDANE